MVKTITLQDRLKKPNVAYKHQSPINQTLMGRAAHSPKLFFFSFIIFDWNMCSILQIVYTFSLIGKVKIILAMIKSITYLKGISFENLYNKKLNGRGKLERTKTLFVQ